MPDTLLTFEDFKEENGAYFWWASDLMHIMGYDDLKPFQKVIDKVTKVLISLSISHQQEIKYIDRIIEKNCCRY